MVGRIDFVATTFLLIIAIPSPALAWIRSDTTDRITGRRIVATQKLALDSFLDPPRRERIVSPRAELTFTCYGGEAWVTIGIPNALVAGHSNRVAYRFDDGKPEESRAWRASSGNSAIGLWTTSATRAFLTKAKGKGKLLFRSTTEVFGTMEAEFDLGGLDDAVSEVRKACKI